MPSIDRRIRIIRFWMACFAALVAAIVWPEFAVFLPLLGMVPCPDCCPAECDILNDPFTTDNLATDWDDRAGTWTVGSGTLNTTSASALIVTTAETPTASISTYATATITCATTSDIGRLIVAYEDDDNYWFCEIQPGASNGTFKMFQRSGGTNTQRGSTRTVTGFSAGDTATVCIGYTHGAMRSNALHAGANIGNSYTTSVTTQNTQGGCGTGAGSSDVKFDDFIFGLSKGDDTTCRYCTPPLNCCSNHTPPPRMQIVVSGIIDADCTDSESLNGTFIFNYTEADVACGGTAGANPLCLWVYDDPGVDICGLGGVLHMAYASGGGLHDINFYSRVGAACGAGIGTIEETGLSQICDELAGLVVDATVNFGSLYSNGGSAKAEITSLP